jgi:hypothetical protein
MIAREFIRETALMKDLNTNKIYLINDKPTDSNNKILK